MLGNQVADSLFDQVANSLLDQVHVKDYFGGGIIFPGNTIPDSLSHRMDSSYSSSCKIDISGDWENEDEIKGIVFCVIEPIRGNSSYVFPDYCHFQICNNGGIKIIVRRIRDIEVQESDHVWMEYFILKYSSEVMGDTLQVEINFFPFMVKVVH